MSEPTKYPLAWPTDVPRSSKTEPSKFKASLSSALNNVRDSLRRFGTDTGVNVEEIILSSNVGGLDPGHIEDTGVAAWFKWDGEQRCVAVDRYPKVEDNLQAIHHILEARRTEMRHGGLNIVRQTFRSFTALPAPKGSVAATGWRAVLNFGTRRVVSLAEANARYRDLAKERQNDADKMRELNLAIEQARSELQ